LSFEDKKNKKTYIRFYVTEKIFQMWEEIWRTGDYMTQQEAFRDIIRNIYDKMKKEKKRKKKGDDDW